MLTTGSGHDRAYKERDVKAVRVILLASMATAVCSEDAPILGEEYVGSAIAASSSILLGPVDGLVSPAR